MGRTQIVEGVMKAPLERWAGPYRSAYGWHLVRVSGRSISAPYKFEDVRDQVRADYLEEQRAAEHRKTRDQMRQHYAVTVEGRTEAGCDRLDWRRAGPGLLTTRR